MLENLILWDQKVFIFLNGLGTATYDTFWTTYTHLPNWTPLYLLFAGLIFRTFPWRQAIAICISVVILTGAMDGLTDLVKEAVGRVRPCNEPELRGVIRVLSKPSTFSFFSGHSTFAFSLTTIMVLFLRKKYRWIYLFFVWAVLMAFSRIYVGVHYPGDVLIGALVGTSAGILCYRGFWRLSKRYIP